MRYRVQGLIDDVLYLIKLGVIIAVVVCYVIPHLPKVISWVKGQMNQQPTIIDSKDIK